MNKHHSHGIKDLSLLLGMLLLLSLLCVPPVHAANNPGHDTLYVLKIGDNMTGNLNLTGNLTSFLVQVSTRLFGTYLDIQANGSPSGGTNSIVGTSTDLYLASTGKVFLANSGGNWVQVGGAQTSHLNVSGNMLLGGNLSTGGTIRLYSNGTGVFADGTSVGGSPVCTSANGLCGGSGSNISTFASPNSSIIIAYNSTAVNLTVNNTFIWNFVNASFNYSAAIGDLRTANTTLNTTATNLQTAINNLQTANTTLNTTATNLQTAINNLQTANTTLNTTVIAHTTAINNLQTANTTLNTSVTNILNVYATQNSTVARTGNCAAGTVAQNLTTTGPQCVTSASGSGTITGTGGAAGNISYWTNATNLASSNIYTSGGLIGINTTSPGVLLDIGSGNLRMSNNQYVQFLNTTGSTQSVLGLDSSNDLKINAQAGRNLFFQQGASTKMVIDTSGNIGIGTTAPTAMLTVNSSSAAGSLLVKNSTATHLFVNGSSGYVGIGTATPSYLLQIENTGANPSILLNRTDGIAAYFNAATGFATIGTLNSSPLRLATGGTARVTIDENGSVGIGTTAPTQELDVWGNISVTNSTALSATPSNNNCVILPGGGKACGNSTCTVFYSPNGNTTVQVCN